MKYLLNKILSFWGYSIFKKDKWRVKNNIDFLDLLPAIYDKIKPKTMLNDLRLANIVYVTRHILKSNITGDFVECGVWKGGSIALAAHIIKENQQERAIHLFDIFDDICEPDKNIDGERAIKDVGGLQNAQGRLRPIKGVYDAHGGSGKDVEVSDFIIMGIGYSMDKVNIHKGWFQKTVLKSSHLIDKIAYLRLDGDWYDSTKVCLENLYDLVTIGGVIIVDDYGAYEGCKKAVDEFILNRGLTPLFNYVDDECIFWIKHEN